MNREAKTFSPMRLPSRAEFVMIALMFFSPPDDAAAGLGKGHGKTVTPRDTHIVPEKLSLPLADHKTKNLTESLKALLMPPIEEHIVTSGVSISNERKESSDPELVVRYYRELKHIQKSMRESEFFRTVFVNVYKFPKRRTDPLILDQPVISQEASAVLRESLLDLSKKIELIVNSPVEHHPSIRAAFKKLKSEVAPLE